MASGVAVKTPHFALHLRVHTPQAPLSWAESGSTWLGVVVPKRWARRAVTRNLIRRQIYGLWQSLPRSTWPPGAMVVRLRASFDPKIFTSASSAALRSAVRQELLALSGPRMLQKLQPLESDA